MTFNPSIKNNFNRSTISPEQSAPKVATGSMDKIQAVGSTAKIMSTNASANPDIQSSGALDISKLLSNAASLQGSFADIVSDLSMYNLMAESYSVTLTGLHNEFRSLLENSKGLSTQEIARWKELIRQEKSLYKEMKAQALIMAECINVANAQMKVDSGDNAKTVRDKLVGIHNSILHTQRQADQVSFPSMPPIKEMDAAKEIIQAKRLKLEHLPEHAEPQEKTTPNKPKKRVRFSENVIIHEAKEIEEKVGLETIFEEESIESPFKQGSDSEINQTPHADIVGVPYEDIAKNRGKNRSDQYFGSDVANLSDFASEKE